MLLCLSMLRLWAALLHNNKILNRERERNGLIKDRVNHVGSSIGGLKQSKRAGDGPKWWNHESDSSAARSGAARWRRVRETCWCARCAGRPRRGAWKNGGGGGWARQRQRATAARPLGVAAVRLRTQLTLVPPSASCDDHAAVAGTASYASGCRGVLRGRATASAGASEGVGCWSGAVSDTGAGAAAGSAQGARGGVGSRGSAVTVVLQPVRAAHSDRR